MIKEKLKKEAENWLRKYLLCCNCEKKCNCIDNNSYCEEQVLKSYLAGAEPREKQITELSKHIVELQNDKGDLIDRCRELEAQIEKMKGCSNCMWSDCDGKIGNPPCKYCDFNNKWELRR